MKKFAKSLGYALKGIQSFLSEPNAKYQLTTAILYTAIGLYLNFNYLEWSISLICFAIVLTAEAMNTAIENLVDLVSPDYHEKAGKVKDIAAGAVLISAIFSAIIGVLLIANKLELFSSH